MAHNEIKASNRFVLDKGSEGIYSDPEILVRRAESTQVSRNEGIQNNDENLFLKIEELLNKWIEAYAAEGIILEVVILEIGEDPEGKKYAVDNSVNGAMRRALPELGITPPPMYAY